MKMKNTAKAFAATLISAISASTFLNVSAFALEESENDKLPFMDTGVPLTEGLKAYDVEHYTLRHEIFPDRKMIGGSATIEFTAMEPMDKLELDFDGRYSIDRVEGADGVLEFEKTPAKLYVTLGETIAAGETSAVTVHYEGTPIESDRPPWNGGFMWSETPSGKPWVATSIQFEGCDVWWPCKDHPSGEPNRGLEFFYTVPAGLSAAGNGVLQNVEEHEDGRRTFHWKTELPTNVYGVALNVAPYVRLEQTLTSINGTEIATEFWAIEDHEEDARALFEDEFPKILKHMEKRFGPYPWGQEKFGVAETPHLGMEHQTINAYGNEFRRGAYGYDNLLFHEFAHEWFGNLMSAKNNADLWLHEGGATFADFGYTKAVLGDAAYNAQKYQRYMGIRSCKPVAPRGELSGDEVYHNGDTGPQGDIYPKGAWTLYSLGYAIGEDKMMRAVRRLLYDTPEPVKLKAPIKPIQRSTDDFLAIVTDEAGRDMSWFFEVYLRNAPLPELMSETDGRDLVLNWKTHDDLAFPMPVPVRVNGKMQRVEMRNGQGRIRGGASKNVQIDPMMEILRKLDSIPTCAEREAEEAARSAANDN
ncbi:MAG: peptidase M1 [Hyphococcus sp.]|nr:MAG: peptidase M1 [Marinicaulis sp.]